MSKPSDNDSECIDMLSNGMLYTFSWSYIETLASLFDLSNVEGSESESLEASTASWFCQSLISPGKRPISLSGIIPDISEILDKIELWLDADESEFSEPSIPKKLLTEFRVEILVTDEWQSRMTFFAWNLIFFVFGGISSSRGRCIFCSKLSLDGGV